jgi:hypothetical protein
MSIVRWAAVLAATSFALVVGGASATGDGYCSNVTLAGYDHCDGARHTLWMNHTYVAGGTGVCAGQLDANGSWTGSYSCGNTNATKCYPATVLLYPRIHNSSSAQHSNFYGDEWYGTPYGPCPP